MKITSHILTDDVLNRVTELRSPNHGSTLRAQYLVIHFTAGASAMSSARWLCSPSSKASAHIIIGRDGRIIQLVPFNKVAWHAGRSAWEGRTNLNSCSIGIELDNAGKVMQRADGSWANALGVVVPSDQVVTARHKNSSETAHWHAYSTEQLEAAVEIGGLIVARFGIVDVVGHDDISPGRKHDPGPAFPMESYRSMVMGRAEETPELFETTTVVNIRSGAGVGFSVVSGSPLAKGTRVVRHRSLADWFYVSLVNGADTEGWVNGKFLSRVRAEPL